MAVNYKLSKVSRIRGTLKCSRVPRPYLMSTDRYLFSIASIWGLGASHWYVGTLWMTFNLACNTPKLTT